MVDVRLYLREKYRPMRPAEWQAAQKPRNLPPRTAPTPQDRDDDPGPEVLQSDEEEVDHPPTKRHKLERLKHPRLKSFYEPEARLRVERFLADDFQTPYATRAQIHEWYEKFSALGRRNFFIVQEHRATAYHHDLRLQLDGQTLSWAVPRGLTNPGGQNRPLAVETQPHSIAWSLWEGPTVGSVDKPTGVLDAGTYTVHETKSAAKKRIGDAKSGLIAEETIDDEPEDEDYQQERLFRDAYHRASFLPTPAAPSAPGLPASDSSHKRGFVVELNGERWRGLKLHFVHDAFDFKVQGGEEG
ncbi:hypothetical protein DMC30DRAFT_142735 [Rhodotorula diobovata]|uniref:DNA ligase D 3'-phosphoesterase domain-containing protein n=1 Tax=Rhodotorula diobovata TaxID=5288 RepID=A0A5C5FK95_9BASI|nr:hypothetical protein DMC30DRAFT_142735 [Rhodotorula diobovata]